MMHLLLVITTGLSIAFAWGALYTMAGWTIS